MTDRMQAPVKGVIVAAGYGTRLLPITRVVPKELLPLVDRPAIDFIIEEFIEAGIEDVLLISSRRKPALANWFDRDAEMDAVFAAQGATSKLERARPPAIRAHVVRQQVMGGTGDALRLARTFAGTSPVVVAYPDDLFLGENVSAALVEAWQQTGASVLVAEDLMGQDVSRYGVLDVEADTHPMRVQQIVEKPDVGSEPSHWVTYGRYLYTPEFFEELERQYEAFDGDGEFYPMGAMNALAARGGLVSTTLSGRRLDTGTTLDYAKAFVEMAERHPEIGSVFEEWLASRRSG